MRLIQPSKHQSARGMRRLVSPYLGKDRDYAFPIDIVTHESRLFELTNTAVSQKFVTAIEESRRLLDLGADWDDEGAEPIDTETWTRATKFLKSTVAKSCAATALPVPNISPCRDGSIDLFWTTPQFQLLINVKASTASGSDFYGETSDGLVVKGQFVPETHDLSVVVKLLLDNLK